MATVCGFIWWVVAGLVPWFYLNLLLAPAVGYAAGEVISLSVNRKRGTGLAVIAGLAVAISYLINLLFPGGLNLSLSPLLLLDLAALGLGIFIAVTRLR